MDAVDAMRGFEASLPITRPSRRSMRACLVAAISRSARWSPVTTARWSGREVASSLAWTRRSARSVLNVDAATRAPALSAVLCSCQLLRRPLRSSVQLTVPTSPAISRKTRTAYRTTGVGWRNPRGERPSISSLPCEGKTKAPPTSAAELHAAVPRSSHAFRGGNLVQHRLRDSYEDSPVGVRQPHRSARDVVLELDHPRDLRSGEVVGVARLVRVDDAVAALERSHDVARQRASRGAGRIERVDHGEAGAGRRRKRERRVVLVEVPWVGEGDGL